MDCSQRETKVQYPSEGTAYFCAVGNRGVSATPHSCPDSLGTAEGVEPLQLFPVGFLSLRHFYIEPLHRKPPMGT